jgi:K+-transporting ATPase ATPase C chain
MLMHLRRSLVMMLLCTVFFGFFYAFACTGFAQLFFPHQANGSLSAQGSTLIGQNWSLTPCPGHLAGTCVFQGRPDDTGPYAAGQYSTSGGDNPLEANGIGGESGGTNLGPHSAKLLALTQELVAYWHNRGVDPTPDLVTTSASSYDPDITPQDALAEVPMVSAATGISAHVLQALIAREAVGEEWGFMGSSYVDVLQLNVALQRLK